MTKRLFLLSGLAIFAVICNHAGGWGVLSLFWWTDRYRPVNVPNFDQIGTLSYHLLTTVRQLAIFAVPTFLFVAGFFISYSARGNQSQLTWKVILRRIITLLIPYVIWSIVIFVLDYSKGNVYTPVEYLRRLLLGAATPAYYYIILLSQFYLLSPLIVPFVKEKWRWLLLGSAFIQLVSIILRYQNFFVSKITSPIRYLFSDWFITLWVFFFILGLVANFHQHEFMGMIDRFKWPMLIGTIVMGILSIFESEIALHVTQKDWVGPQTVTSNLYAVGFILSFLAFRNLRLPLSNFFNQLGHYTFGIYLTHGIVLDFLMNFFHDHAPMVLARQVILQPLLILFGLGIPLILINLVNKTPARRYYRYVFG